MYERGRQQLPRINNVVEGWHWHNAFNYSIGCSHPSVSKLFKDASDFFKRTFQEIFGLAFLLAQARLRGGGRGARRAPLRTQCPKAAQRKRAKHACSSYAWCRTAVLFLR